MEDLIESEAPDSILLCDFHSCSRFFELAGVDQRFVTRYQIPVIAIDIWNCLETGLRMDHVGGDWVPRAEWFEGVAGRLVPVPIGRLSTSAAYCGLRRQRCLRVACGVTSATISVYLIRIAPC